MIGEQQIGELLSQISMLRGRTVQWQPLAGGLTNSNFRVDVDGESFVLRIHGANTELLGIDRRREVECLRAAAAARIGPEIIDSEERFLLLRYLPGEALSVVDLHSPRMKARVAQALRSSHELPVSHTIGRFCPFETVRNYHTLAAARHVPFPRSLEAALALSADLETQLANDETPCLCHNDLLPANFIDDGATIRIIDWEYAGRGDRFFDLGNLAVNAEWNEQEEADFLRAYFGQARPNDLRRLRLMRLVSDLREAMWGYLQSALSPLHTPDHYLDYGNKHLDRFLLAAGQEMA